MARVRFFAQARDATGCREADIDGATLGEVIDAAVARFGPRLDEVVKISRIWVNGEPAELDKRLASDDEVAVLPPVSGG